MNSYLKMASMAGLLGAGAKLTVDSYGVWDQAHAEAVEVAADVVLKAQGLDPTKLPEAEKNRTLATPVMRQKRDAWITATAQNAVYKSLLPKFGVFVGGLVLTWLLHRKYSAQAGYFTQTSSISPNYWPIQKGVSAGIGWPYRRNDKVFYAGEIFVTRKGQERPLSTLASWPASFSGMCSTTNYRDVFLNGLELVRGFQLPLLALSAAAGCTFESLAVTGLSALTLPYLPIWLADEERKKYAAWTFDPQKKNTNPLSQNAQPPRTGMGIARVRDWDHVSAPAAQDSPVINPSAEVRNADQVLPPKQDIDEKALAEAFHALDDLIGMEEVKARIRLYADFIRFKKFREADNLKDAQPIRMHVILTGDPGVGKTTVADRLARIYHLLGLLSKGHTHKVNAANMLAPYRGQTADQFMKEIEAGRGGVLIIDNAHLLLGKTQNLDGDFQAAVSAILLGELERSDRNISIALIGYEEALQNALSGSDDGYMSRILKLHIGNPSLDQLVEIAKAYAIRSHYLVGPDAEAALREVLKPAMKRKGFGNGRFVEKLIDEAKLRLASRMMALAHPEKSSREDKSMFTANDIRLAVQYMPSESAKGHGQASGAGFK